MAHFHTRSSIKAAALSTALLLCAASGLQAQELRVLSSDASGCTVEYRPGCRTTTFLHKGQRFTSVTFEGAAPLYPHRAGSPDMKFRSAPIVLPSLPGHRVTVMQSDFQDSTDVLLAPVSRFRETDEGRMEEFIIGPGYTSSGFLPSRIAELADAGISRDRYLASLRIYPFQYDASSRRLRLFNRIMVRVDFGAFDPMLGAGTSARVFGISALNESAATAWTLQRPRPVSKTGAAGLASGDWYRIEISEEGVYRLPRSWFQAAGIDLSSLDPRTIRMYGHGGRELPAKLSAPRPENLQEIAIEVRGEADGVFDEGDEVRFFGRGLSGWTYDSSARRYSHYIHRFDRSNAYFLTFGSGPGKRMQAQPSLNESSPHVPRWFTGRDFHEEEAFNFLASGKSWVGKKINPSSVGSSQVLVRKLEGLVRTEPVRYRIQLYSQSEAANSFAISDGSALGVVNMGTVDFGTDRDDIAASSGPRSYSRSGDLPDDRSTLKIEYQTANPEQNRGGYIDWVEWTWARNFAAQAGLLAFSAPDTAAVCAYEVNGFPSSDIGVYDVTDHAGVKVVTNPSVSGGTLRFQAESRAGRPPEYYAVTGSALLAAAAPVRIPNSDLLGANGAEYVIITSPVMLPAANTLKQHREKEGENAISTRVVTLPEIYNEFSGGVIDPAAIRNFLSYALTSWEIKPRYVLLLGDGHFDYRNYTTSETIIVPVWESENSVNLISCYVTDDFYAQTIGDDALVDLSIGRLPVQTVQQAEAVVGKIISYEQSPDFDPWKNRVTFVADDGFTPRMDEGSVHTAQSEDISRAMPQEIEQRKIYIVSYPTENTAQGRRKPSANSDIIEQINRGSVIFNYTGHGSEAVWAHEQVFVSDVTVPQLNNSDRLTFVTAATCTFGLYDRPELQSGTERLILKPDGGAIGGLSSPRLVYSGQNSVFNQTFFSNMIVKGRESDGRMKRIGDAIYSTKQQWHSDAGYEKFHLFSDPALRLAFPRHKCSIDSFIVNGEAQSVDTVQLRALSQVTIKASVRKPDQSIWDDFNGVALVALYDAERRITVPLDGWGGFYYKVLGGLLYRGEASVRDGRFAVSMMVPKDISYENSNGRLDVYFDNGSRDGAGFSTAFRVGGSETAGTEDTWGPYITLYMDSRSFAPGDGVNENPMLIADLFDESGINTTGLGIGHNIEAWLDDEPVSVVLNDYYRGERDSWQRGAVEYQYRALAEGRHSLRLRAWDIHNNPGSAETWFNVQGGGTLTVGSVYAYPNPTSEGSTFSFTHNQQDAVDVEVRIYTAAGRMIRTLEIKQARDRFVRVEWDGLDADGARPANGTYFFKLTCLSEGGKRGTETVGTVSVLR